MKFFSALRLMRLDWKLGRARSMEPAEDLLPSIEQVLDDLAARDLMLVAFLLSRREAREMEAFSSSSRILAKRVVGALARSESIILI